MKLLSFLVAGRRSLLRSVLRRRRMPPLGRRSSPSARFAIRSVTAFQEHGVGPVLNGVVVAGKKASSYPDPTTIPTPIRIQASLWDEADLSRKLPQRTQKLRFLEPR